MYSYVWTWFPDLATTVAALVALVAVTMFGWRDVVGTVQTWTDCLRGMHLHVAGALSALFVLGLVCALVSLCACVLLFGDWSLSAFIVVHAGRFVHQRDPTAYYAYAAVLAFACVSRTSSTSSTGTILFAYAAVQAVTFVHALLTCTTLRARIFFVETVAVLVEGVKPSGALAWVSQKYQHRIALDWWEDVGGLHEPLASMSARYLLFCHRDFHGTTSPLWTLGVVKCVFSKYEQFSKLDKKLMLLFARAMPVHYLVDITVEAVCNGDRRCLDVIKPVLLLDWYVRDAEILTHACTELCRRSGGSGTEAQLCAVSVLFDAHAGWLLDVKEVKQVAAALVQRKRWSMMRRAWIEACTAAAAAS